MYLGIDVSKDSLDCFKLDQDRSFQNTFENSKQGLKKLLSWLKDDQEVLVTMEATGVYWQACAFTLYEAGYKLSIVNPAQVKFFAKSMLRRGKTDKMDAELIALYAQKMQPNEWLPTEIIYDELKLFVRERDDMVAQLRQLQNQFHAHQHRYRKPSILLKLLKQRLSFLKKQLKDLEQMIDKLCKEHMHDAYESLRSIPGIGQVTASVLLAETAGLANFVHPKQVSAFSGISPAPNQSGTFQGQASISKIGNARIRKAFYMAALQARNHSVFNDLYDRLISRGKATKVALIAVARKLLVIAFTLVKSLTLFDPNFLSKDKALTS